MRNNFREIEGGGKKLYNDIKFKINLKFLNREIVIVYLNIL